MRSSVLPSMRAIAIILLLLVVPTLVLSGCGGSRRHRHCNPDGSITYYRFHRDHTHECVCRSIYHPNCHYYHAHY